MANQFYARYIPTKPAITETEPEPDNNFTQTQPSKRRKITPSSQVIDNDTFQNNENNEEARGDHTSVETHGLVPIPQPSQKPKEAKPAFSALPTWLAHPKYVHSTETVPIDSLPLNPKTLASLKNKGYEHAFAIQKAVLPLLLRGSDRHPGDICIAAATGSGKTLAYALPMIEDLRDKPSTRLRGLVVVPTRELVAQVRETFELCGSGSGLKVATSSGSKSLKEEQDLLIGTEQKYDPDAYRLKQEQMNKEEETLLNWDFDDVPDDSNQFECLLDHVIEYVSRIDILICTPGRLVDHMKSTKGFTLNYVQWLVVDEADRLLDESFQQWVDIVMPALENQTVPRPVEQQLQQTFHLARYRKVRKIILSASMTNDITKLTSLKLKRPMMIILETTSQDRHETVPNGENFDSQKILELPPTLQEVAIPIRDAEDKPLYLIELLETSSRMATNSIHQGQQNRRPHVEKVENSFTSSSSHSDSSSDESLKASIISTDSSDSSSPPLPTKIVSASSEPGSIPSLAHGTLIFTNNNENALRLARLLILLRPAWSSQIGTLTKSSVSSSKRKALSAFRNRKLSLLIASDRASRGLDIPDLAHVINYDMPTGTTSYIHRVGRTARAGKVGLATTFVVHHEARWFWNEIAKSKEIIRGSGKKIRRVESKLEIGEKEKKVYEDALKLLGLEVSNESHET